MMIELNTGTFTTPMVSIIDSVYYSSEFVERVVYRVGEKNPVLRVESGYTCLLTCYGGDITVNSLASFVSINKILPTTNTVFNLADVQYKATIQVETESAELELDKMGWYELVITDKTADIIVTVVSSKKD